MQSAIAYTSATFSHIRIAFTILPALYLAVTFSFLATTIATTYKHHTSSAISINSFVSGFAPVKGYHLFPVSTITTTFVVA